MSDVPNLWGDLRSLKTIRTPKTILTEQANILTNATSGVVRAEVTSTSAQASANLSHTLIIVAPALNNYVYQLLTVSHGIDIYPCQMYDYASKLNQSASDEEDFQKRLGVILASPKTRSVIESLLSQSKS